MKSFTSTLLALGAALSLVAAAPAAEVTTRTAASIPVTLYGAAGASYTTDVYFGDVPTYTYNSLSISSVSYDDSIAYCYFYGVDEATAPPVIANGGQLGPPQTVVSILCEYYE
ncbi:hypothetical protein EG329_003981 [Mollisiaceae sp. DMI_Dod_QoI]|nr:hypothetical protein EG329_003981 [Helotiales sp. DMI_Dod_QoI]